MKPGTGRHTILGDLERAKAEIEQLRKHIQAEYDRFHAHHPYAHELRKKYPWVAAAKAGKGE